MQSHRLPPYVCGKLIFMLQSASEVQEPGTLPPEDGERQVSQLQEIIFILPHPCILLESLLGLMMPTHTGGCDLRAPVPLLSCSRSRDTPYIGVFPAFWAVLSLVPLKNKIKHCKVGLKSHEQEKNK